ncbi:hypothetical protein PPSIR1_07907 [Plesiocystis pacifica SIR-1]|uniref:Arylsulfotransferase N-terminal domain-containing protein n=1 Tax=Plesiocystis pacifica SIR-1 TaxID=391625 RepID=A6GCX6_9BACT|nr:aryl-sulfate sulfotransferase [Plesiocystis pacifica]EDM76300.1 hypothetical protein PPSIR1_07907 [Plesiocystis pacifica SIR-1]
MLSTTPARAPHLAIAVALAPLLALACNTGDEDEGNGDEAADAHTEPELSIEVEVYPNSPLVIDLVIPHYEGNQLGTIHVVHPDDPGISHELVPSTGDELRRVRVRGLAPDTAHGLELHVVADGHDLVEPVTVMTEPALPGFIPAFEVEPVDPDDSETVQVIFDLAGLFTVEPQNLFAVDREGVTRWHYSQLPESANIDELWTGLTLRPDGTVLSLRGNVARIVDELGQERMHVSAADLDVPGLHHDIIELPNGNFLAIGVEFQDIDYGGDEGVLPVAGDTIVEFTPEGERVWLWDSFDHLDVHRRLPDFWGMFMITNPETGVASHDWTHANGLIYDEARDEVLLSLRHQDWLVAVDRGSGEITWRMGTDGDFALSEGTWFWHQHSPQWLADGSLILYDNDIGDPLDAPIDVRSRVVRYAVDRDAMTAAQVWVDDGGEYSSIIASSVALMPGGHYLVLDSLLASDAADPFTDAHARIRELAPEASPQAVWSLHTPNNSFSYRAIPTARWMGQSSE